MEVIHEICRNFETCAALGFLAFWTVFGIVSLVVMLVIYFED